MSINGFNPERAVPVGVPDFNPDRAVPHKPAGLIRQLADKGVGLASGALDATSAIAGAAGANNPVEGVIRAMADRVRSGLSQEAQDDSLVQQRILAGSAGKGTFEELKAGAKAFMVAPVQTAVTGLGSVAPILAAGLATRRLPPSAAMTAMTGMGAAQGAGSVKSGIFEEIERRALEAGKSPEQARGEATAAQEYQGPNAASIAAGAALGTADAATGVAKNLVGMIRGGGGAFNGGAGGVISRMARGAAGEVPIEAAQGGQQQYAQNVAAQRAGYDANAADGVAAQAAFEGLASAGPGAAFGAFHKARGPLEAAAFTAPDVQQNQPQTPEGITPDATQTVASAPAEPAGNEPVSRGAEPATDPNVQDVVPRVPTGPLSDAATIAPPVPNGVDAETGEVMAEADKPGEAPPAKASEAEKPRAEAASFASYDEASGFIKAQKQRGTTVQALPVPREDGTFGLAQKGGPDYPVAEAHQKKRALTERGVKDGDILAKSGEPFKVRLGAIQAHKKAGVDNHHIAQVKEGFVVRTGKLEESAAHAAATSPLNDLPEPTQAQKEAGNYKVGRLRIAGLDIAIENPQGSTRRGTDADGKAWESPMNHHYGYFNGTLAADGEKLDVFVKPGTAEDYAGRVFVIDQVDPKTGKLDEHKVVMGAADEAEAEAIYRSNYTPDWQGMGAITGLPLPAFKAWAKSGKLKEPLGDLKAKPEASQPLPNPNNEQDATNAAAEQASNVQDQAPRTPGQAEPAQDQTGEAAPGDVAGTSATHAVAGPAKVEAAGVDPTDYFEELFGSQEQRDAAQAQYVADQTNRKAAIQRIRDEIARQKERATAEYADWSGRKYKANKKQVDLRGDGPSNQASMPIGAINENRRRNAMNALAQELAEIDKLAAVAETESGAEKILANLTTLREKATEAVKSGNWPGSTEGSMFESMLLDALKFRGPAGKGNVTSNGLSKAMLAAINAQNTNQIAPIGDVPGSQMGAGEMPGQSAALPTGGVEAFGVDMAPVASGTHNGTRIYPIKMAGRDGAPPTMRWAVESADNKQRRESGDRNRGGDSLHTTIEEAKKAADFEAKQDQQKKERLKGISASEKAEKDAADARREANKGKSLTEIKAQKYMAETVKDGATGEEITRAEWVKRLVDGGEKPSIEMVNKIKPLSRNAYNRATNQEQAAHEKKIRDGGKVPEYSIGNYIVSKTEHDYAQTLAGEGLTAPTQQDVLAQQGRKPGTAPSGPDLFGGLTEQETTGEEQRLDGLRKQLVALEDKIVGAAGMAPDFIEQAMQSRKVPKELKDRRNELRAELRDARERLSGQRAAPATKSAADMTPAELLRAAANKMEGKAKPADEGTGPLFSRTGKEDPRDLIIQHNLTAENLLHAERMGGIPVPSLAITKAAQPLENFGEITLLGDVDMATPRGDMKVFGADIYSPRYPTVQYKPDNASLKRIKTVLEPFRNDGEYSLSELRTLDDLTGDKAFVRYADSKAGGTASYAQLKSEATKLARESGAEERIFQGFTYSGNRKYKAHTLDNVIAILKKELRGGESFNYGAGSLRAKFTPQFRTIKAIRNSKDRLITTEAFEVVKDEINKELLDLSYDMVPNGGFRSSDTGMAILEDGARMGLRRAAKEYDIELSDEQVERANEFLQKLRNLPTAYFEAKALRAMDLSEFKVAVVPDNLDVDARRALEKRGVKIVTYEKGNTEARTKAIADASAENGLMFSRAPAWTSDLRDKLADAKMESSKPDGWRMFMNGLKTKGVKPDEIEWSGVNEWLQLQTGRVTKAQVLDYLDGNGVKVEEVTLGDDNGREKYIAELNALSRVDLIGRAEDLDIDVEAINGNRADIVDAILEAQEGDMPAADDRADGSTKYSQYTLPGGTNYREVLLTLPRKEVTTGDVAQRMFGKPMSELTDEQRGFVANEMRSQSGANLSLKDYRSSHWDTPNVLAHIRVNDRVDADGKRVLFVEEIQSDFGQDAKKKGVAGTIEAALKANGMTRAEFDAMPAEDQQFAIDETKPMGLPPNAPFIDKTDKWLTLALKRVITMAAQEGYDKVAFVNGEQSAERYDLSKQVDTIGFLKNSDGTITLEVEKDGRTLQKDDYQADKLGDVVGKELAQKIIDSPDVAGEMSGLDLKVGGEGMKAFYDQIVPNTLKGVLKKVGGAGMETVELQIPGLREGDKDSSGATIGPKGVPGKNFDATGFTITDDMRNKASNGLPTFKRSEGIITRMAKTQAQTAVDAITAKWKSGPKVKVVNTYLDLPVKAPRDVKGMYYQGTAYVVAMRHRNAQDVGRTLAHEVIAHHGLRNMLGRDDWMKLMKQVQFAIKAGNKPLNALLDTVRERYVNEDGSYTLSPNIESDEIIALGIESAVDENGEFKPGYGMFKAVWAKIATFLRDMGINIKFTNAELQGMLVLAQRELETGKKAEGGAQVLVAASRGEDAQASRGTNEPVTKSNDVVGNQGGRSADDIPPGVQSRMVAAYNEELKRDGNDIPPGYFYREVTRSDVESMYGDMDDVPAKIREALERGEDVIEWGTDSDGGLWLKSEAPTEQEYYDDARKQEGWPGPVKTIDQIFNTPDMNESAASDAFRVLAEAEGWSVDGGVRYVEISKPNDDPAGIEEGYDTIRVNVRISNHSRTANATRPTNAKEIDINLAPQFGNGNEFHHADTWESALKKMRSASVGKDGDLKFVRNRSATEVSAVGANSNPETGSGANTGGADRSISNESPAPTNDGAPERVDQTDTPEFKAWFKGSKVVDAEGKPLRVYHGTTANFSTFNVGGEESNAGAGIYLGTANHANVYASGVRGEGANVMPVYAAIKRPLVVHEKSINAPLEKIAEQHPDIFGGRNPYDDMTPAEATAAMKAAGYDGVIHYEGSQDGDASVYQYVAFAPEQIKSAIGNRGTFDPNDPDIRYSRGPDALAETLSKITVTDVRKRAGNKLGDYRGIGLQMLGRRQLVDIYSKDLPTLDAYSNLVQQMEADKNETGALADEIAQNWGKLKDDRPLAEMMHDATVAQIDPSKPHVPGDNRMQYGTLRARWDALSPEARKVYQQARDAYEEHYSRVREEIRNRIERSGMSATAKGRLLERMDGEFFEKIKGVYFPLARFGKFVVVTRDNTGKVVDVGRAETMNEAQALRSQLLNTYPSGKGYNVGKVIKDKEFNAARDAVGRGFLKQLFGVLDQEGVGGELQDAVNQLYLQSMPDLSWAKHGIHRKGTPGFSQDARRAFAQNMFHGARYLAKLRYADQLQTKLDGMQEHVDANAQVEGFDQPKAQDVVDEMVKRHDSLMNPKTNGLSTALTSFGFVFHLGMSPASALVNLSQTALVAYPVMAAKWGYDKAGTALLKAGREAAVNGNDIGKVLTGDERRAYEEAVRAGTIDVTMAHDLAGISQGEDAKVTWALRPVMRWASFMFHHAERFNRQVTFVAAYRLAREAGSDHESATAQATRATYDGHFDYSSSNRARIMQGNAAKVLLLFKQFGQNMVYTIARQAQQSLKGETPQARREARRALGGLLAMHAAGAGLLGLPLVTTLLGAASMLGGSDDEPWDAEVALRNMLTDAFGAKPAEVMARGFSRLTPWDISGRVGLDRLILPDVQEGLEGQRLGESAMAAALGPVAGIGVNVLKGLQEMGDGNYTRGLETMMPSALRGPMRALRYADEGAQDRTGVSIVDEVSVSGIVGQALGLSPSDVRLASEAKGAVLSADRRVSERRSALLAKYSRAVLAGDDPSEVREEIDAFNAANPGRRIGAMHMQASVRARNRRIAGAEGGVYLPRNRTDAREAGRFGQME